MFTSGFLTGFLINRKLVYRITRSRCLYSNTMRVTSACTTIFYQRSMLLLCRAERYIKITQYVRCYCAVILCRISLKCVHLGRLGTNICICVVGFYCHGFSYECFIVAPNVMYLYCVNLINLIIMLEYCKHWRF